MKRIVKKCFMLLVFLTAVCSNIATAQAVYKIKDSKDIDMKLSGTSTLHKWVMNAKTFTGEAQFIFDTTKTRQLTSLIALNFSLEVENLKSDEKMLDKNAYKALKTDEYKDIVYRLVSSKVVHGQDNKYLIKTRGNLTIAGVTRAITMEVYCLVNADSTITCTGSKKLKMSDYKVKPPTFMLGAMKTGDAIALDFILVYKMENTAVIN